MSKKIVRRDFIKKGGAIVVGFAFGMLGDLKFNSKEGIRIGREKVKFGMAEAHATCGAAYTCAGGGGDCGAAYTCSGEGYGGSGYGGSGQGQCGAAYTCSGGGGQCGAAYTCSGS